MIGDRPSAAGCPQCSGKGAVERSFCPVQHTDYGPHGWTEQDHADERAAMMQDAEDAAHREAGR